MYGLACADVLTASTLIAVGGFPPADDRAMDPLGEIESAVAAPIRGIDASIRESERCLATLETTS